MAVTEDQVCEWTRDLCSALEAHEGKHSLSDYLQQATQKQTSVEFRAILESVCAAVGQGHPLSWAFSQHPEVFSAAYVATIRYGEIYGEVDLVLRRYVEHPEDRYQTCRMPSQSAV